jgi:hypothetical protein
VVLTTFWVIENFISGLLYNTNRRNTKLGMEDA